MKPELKRHYTGAASEFFVAAILSVQGNDVFFPDTPARADIVYVTPAQEVVRVQVKTSTRSQTGPHWYEQTRLVKKHGGDPYTADEIDELWVVGTHIGRFPVSVIAGRTSLSLLNNGPRGTDPNEYTPHSFIVKRGTWENPIRSVFSLDTPDAVI